MVKERFNYVISVFVGYPYFLFLSIDFYVLETVQLIYMKIAQIKKVKR